MRAYLCVQGGFSGPRVLGSQSALDPLQAGMALACHSGTVAGRFVRADFEWNREPRRLRVIEGPQAEWFPGNALYALELTVSPTSNRMGLRLAGEAIPWPGRELVSEPVGPGAVQVTRDGQCIILGVDGQTIGGYPKIAHVITADLDKLGQLRPGDVVHFQPVSLSEAVLLNQRKQAELNQWLGRLREI
jgi:antagonist of KipI